MVFQHECFQCGTQIFMKMIFADETVRMCFERIKNIFFSCRYKDDDRILLMTADLQSKCDAVELWHFNI